MTAEYSSPTPQSRVPGGADDDEPPRPAPLAAGWPSPTRPPRRHRRRLRYPAPARRSGRAAHSPSSTRPAPSCGSRHGSPVADPVRLPAGRASPGVVTTSRRSRRSPSGRHRPIDVPAAHHRISGHLDRRWWPRTRRPTSDSSMADAATWCCEARKYVVDGAMPSARAQAPGSDAVGLDRWYPLRSWSRSTGILGGHREAGGRGQASPGSQGRGSRSRRPRLGASPPITSRRSTG